MAWHRSHFLVGGMRSSLPAVLDPEKQDVKRFRITSVTRREAVNHPDGLDRIAPCAGKQIPKRKLLRRAQRSQPSAKAFSLSGIPKSTLVHGFLLVGCCVCVFLRHFLCKKNCDYRIGAKRISLLDRSNFSLCKLSAIRFVELRRERTSCNSKVFR